MTGTNSKVALFSDNVAIRHTRDVTDTVNATGVMVLFLPPYSPNFMPCEMFAQAKYWIRENDIAWLTLSIESFAVWFDGSALVSLC